MRTDDSSLWAVIDSRDTEVELLRARLEDQHAELAKKESVIQSLTAQLAEKEGIVRALTEVRDDASCAEGLAKEQERKEEVIKEMARGLEAVNQAFAYQLAEKEEIIRELIEAHSRAIAGDGMVSMRELERKEAVIKEMAGALSAYRATYAVLGVFIIPLNHFVLGVRSLARRTTKHLTPKLGVLNQHEPRALRIPDHYGKARALASAPRLSIVTPSFGQAQFIERTIRSILDQAYPNLDYHVQDGGSKDGTREVLEKYGRRLSWDSRPDSGQSEAINRGFSRADGEIMAWLNSDDILLPGALAYVIDYFNRHPEVDVVYGHRILIDENDQQIGRWMLPEHNDEVLSWADYVPQETLFWRRRIWDKAGGCVDESFRFAMDWDLLVRFRDAGARFARVPRFIGGFRIHVHQKTSASIAEVGFDEMDRIRKRVLGRVPSRIQVRKAVLPYLLKHVATDVAWRLRQGLGLQS